MVIACLQQEFVIEGPSERQRRHVADSFGNYAHLQDNGTLHVDLLKWLEYKQEELHKRLTNESGSKVADKRVPREIYNLSTVWDWIESHGRKVKGDLKEMSESARDLCQFIKGQFPKNIDRSAREEERERYLSRSREEDPKDHGYIDEDWTPEESVCKALPKGVRLVKCCHPIPVRNPYRNDGHRLNLNTVSVQDMVQKLPGIGKEIAERIQQNRPFKHVHDLLHIRGIGDRKVECIHPFVTVGEEEPRHQRKVTYLAFKIDSQKVVGPFSDIHAAVAASKQLVEN